MCNHEEIKDLYSKGEYRKVREIIESNEICMSNSDTCRIWAQAYYQDTDLIYTYSYDKALKILNKIQNDNNFRETLRLKGAVYKRWWEKSEYTKDEYFEKSSENYLKAIGNDNKSRIEDKGYGAYNALYLYILKDFNSKTYEHKEQINNLLEKTLKIFEDIEDGMHSNIIGNMTNYKDYWYYITISQLYVIKKNFEKVKYFLQEAKKCLKEQKVKGDNPKRQMHVSLSEIIKLIKATDQLSNKQVEDFIKETFPSYFTNSEDIKERIEEIIDSIERPKLGIALSGGGFRASLFHLGVFARLAEINMLKHVETISAVSGGSIVAMAYYLKLKEKLEEKTELKHEDYINLVDKLIQDFLKAIQKNIRILAFSNFSENIKILKSDLLNGDYTRTNYLGKLYVNQIYKIDENTLMKDIKIIPKGYDSEEKFHPYLDNWNRASKVPNLIINATNIVTGHNWKITASGMGETVTMITDDIDKNRIYEYCRYEQFKSEELQNFRLSDAIAASSAVPGLFEPIVLNICQKEKIKLLDGGVYDNQGIQSLMHDNCKTIICSDASGYFEDELELSSSKNKIFKRTTDNLMNITRDLLYKQIKEQLKQGNIKAFEYFHLKKELIVEKISIDKDSIDKDSIDISEKTTSYNVNHEIQNLLSKIRTDLDSFHDVESFALMGSGYNMCLFSQELAKDNWNKYKSKEIKKIYMFDNYKDILLPSSNQNETDRRIKLLEISKRIPFKLLIRLH